MLPLGVIVCLTFLPLAHPTVLRCSESTDCPAAARCFKDECARCLCGRGSREMDFYSDGKLTKVCLIASQGAVALVGGTCTGGRRCPVGSHCDPVTSTCACHPSLVAHVDKSHCRLSTYNEECDIDRPCNRAHGYACVDGFCACAVSYHRPTRWAKFVLRRWKYSTVAESQQECIARAVGEPCKMDAECGAVAGSGARCGLCGYCECRKRGHVPDASGTKCGAALHFGDICTLQGSDVCDGTLGLQCGDMCDLYDYSFIRMRCSCSQMHQLQDGRCVLKVLNSSCSTDWDCFPLQGGLGYCHEGRCTMDDDSPSHQPSLPRPQCSPGATDPTSSTEVPTPSPSTPPSPLSTPLIDKLSNDSNNESPYILATSQSTAPSLLHLSSHHVFRSVFFCVLCISNYIIE
ncbi:hypothetical protein CAPTEDRAFT_226552 [Capitella teleta]|uniref:EB domain-containing protein n=1 Tax=Capitella teleta TaxID=283909 RepID=R7TXS1_CAPTE|nr:hypothetical protein CAPTEDRAFT_226552 [Capitella teleta]|eukprot:ELT96236.1 hypothetical protein CAPTEDRAFT_226552 [Capitella teleta]